jgi:iron complex outermembrane receptor protein
MLFRVSGQYATVNRDLGARIDAVIRALRSCAACSVLGAATLAGSAYAQTGATGPSNSGQAADSSSGALEEIVVTARKREERLIDVPVAVTAVSAATINEYQATTLSEIGNLVPGVSLERTQSGSSGAVLTIRGVGNLASDYGNEQPVAVNIDGVQITKGHVADIGFFDLDSVQVLKGPQSLFFGKNSPAGVVVLNSVTPGTELEGYMKGSYEFTADNPAVEGAISIPLSDTLSIRIAGRYSDQLRGYVVNNAQSIPDPFDPGDLTLPGALLRNGPEARTGISRFTVAWRPGDGFDATLKVLWSDYRDRGSGLDGDEVFTCGTNPHPTTINLLNPAQAYLDPFEGCSANRITSDGGAPAQIADHFFGAPANGMPYSHTSTILSSLYLNYTLPDVKFTSVTGVYDASQGGFDNFDDTVYAQALDSQSDRDNQLSQEIRAASTFAGPLNYTVGAYYEYDRHKVQDTDKIFPLGPYPVPGPYFGYWNTLQAVSSDLSKNYSFFGQLSWKILDNLELAGGARYSRDDRSAVIGNTFNFFDALVPAAANPFSPAGVTYSPHVKESNTSPEATLTYHPVHDFMVYAAYKTGYLAGGVANPANVSNYTTLANPDAAFEFGEEKVKGGEFGLKGLFLDGKFQGELTFFDYRYTDLQVETFNPQTISYTIRNAGSSTDKGIELQGQYAFDTHWSAHASLELIDLTFGSYSNAQCYPGQTVAQGCNNAGAANASQDLSGTRYGDSPVSANIGLSYEDALTSSLNYKLASDVFYNSRSPLYERDPWAYTPAYSLVNASVTVYRPGSRWMFHAIGTNLGDASYFKNYIFKPLGANNDIAAETIALPRMITIEADYKF